jgi:signal transduction histidine kinase
MNNLSRLLLFAVFISLTGLCKAAYINTDSLSNLNQYNKKDSNYVKTLISLSKDYSIQNRDSAMLFCNLAYKIADSLSFASGKIDALSCKSYYFKQLGKYDSALLLGKEAINIAKNIKDQKRLADNICSTGYLIMITENSEEALKYFRESNMIYSQVPDSMGIAKTINAIGIVHKRNAVYDSAVYYYLEYISLCEKLGYKTGITNGFINLGQIYMQMEDYERAKIYLNNSIAFSEELQLERHLSVANMKLGIIAFEEQDYDKAISYYTKASEINTRINNIPGMANAYNNIGNSYLKQKKYDKALAQLKKAFDLYQKMGDNEGIVINLVNQAMIMEELGKYDKELHIYDSCLLLLEDLNLNQTKLTIYKNIYNAWELKGNKSMAYEYIQKYMMLKDSLFNIEKSKEIADLQLKYDTEKKEAKILQLENETIKNKLVLKARTNQRNIYLFGGLGFIIIGLLLFAYYRQRVKKDKIIARQKIRQLEEEKKLLSAKALVEGQEEERKRIAKELHDGLGVILSTAKMHFSKVVESKTDDPALINKATRLLEQAASDVRRISHNMMPGVLTKLGLVEAIEDILDEIDDIPGTTAIFSLTGEEIRLPENTEIMLFRVVQEMINNTLKHAEAIEIGVNMNFSTENLRISVSDNGKGFDLDEKLKSKSIGLRSIQSRIDFINGNLKIESKPGHGTSYNMIIPLRKTK